jgi:non-ribosomal peptide synthetase component F
MALLAVFELLLGHEGGGDDFLVGTDVANRPLPEVEPLIGLFVNQVVLRADLSGEPSFRDLLRRVRETALDAFAHQELPLESVIREVAPERSSSHNPLFQVLFLLQNFPEEENFGDGNAPEPEEERIVARFDLKAELREVGGTVRGWFEGRTDLFKESSLERMTTRYRRFAALAVENPDQPISTLRRRLDEEEQRESQERSKDLKKKSLSKLRERVRN